MPVPVIANPFTGLYGSPRPSSTATVSTNDKTIASTGERCLGWTRASAAGNAPMRPIANDIRDAMFTPALALRDRGVDDREEDEEPEQPVQASAPCPPRTRRLTT